MSLVKRSNRSAGHLLLGVAAAVVGLSCAEPTVFEPVRPGELRDVDLASFNATSFFGYAGDSIPVRLTLRDQRGRALRNQRVDFATLPGSGRVLASSVTTTEAGLAETTWIPDSVTGNQRLRVTVGGVSRDFTATVAAGRPQRVLASRDSVRFVALTDSIRLTVGTDSVFDRFNNVVPSTRYSLRWSSDNDAVATVSATGVVRSVAPGTTMMRARVDSGTRNFTQDSVRITVRQVTTQVQVSQVTVAARSVGDSVRLQAQSRDARGQPVAGDTVVLEPVQGNVTGGLLRLVTDATGRATWTWVLAGVVGAQRHRVRWPGALVDSVSVDAAVGAPASLVLSRDTLNLDALTAVDSVSATVRDRFGNIISGAVPTWTLPAAGAVAFTGTLSSLTRRLVAQANGTTPVIASAGGPADTLRVIVQQVPVTVDTIPAGVRSLTVNGTWPLTDSVTVRDRLGQRVVGAVPTVTFDSSAGPAVLAGTVLQGAAGGSTIARLRVGTVVRSVRFNVGTPVATTLSVTSAKTDTVRSTSRTRPIQSALLDQFGAPITGTPVFESRDTAIARVVGTSYTALRAGATWVVGRPQSGANPTDSVRVVVVPAGASVRVSPRTISLVAGDSTLLTWEYRDSAGASIAGLTATPSFATSAAGIAIASVSGRVRGVAAGSAAIIATSALTGSTADTIAVTVSPSAAAGLIGYWPLAGNANDSTANGRNGVATNTTPTADQYGVSGRALAFNGTNAGVEVADSPAFRFGTSASFTVAHWVQFNTVAQPVQTIVSKYSNATGSFAYLTAMTRDTINWLLAKQNFAPNSQLFGPRLQSGRWYHMVATYDGVTQRLYVDGSLVGQLAYSGGGGAAVGDSTMPLRFGQQRPTDPYWLNGSLSQVRLYNTSLSALQVRSLFEATGGTNTIAVSPQAPSVTAGDSILLTAIERDAAGTIVSRANTWTSRTPAVATVTAAGYARGVSAGTSWIVSTADGKSDSTLVTVSACAWCGVTVDLTGNALPTGWSLAGTENGSGVVNQRLERTGLGFTEIGANGSPPSGTTEIDASFTIGGYIASGVNSAQPLLQLRTPTGTHVLTVSTTAAWGTLGRLEYQLRSGGTVRGLGGTLGTTVGAPQLLSVIGDTGILRARALLWRDTVNWELRRVNDNVLVKTLRMVVPGLNPADVTGVYVAAYSGGPTTFLDSIIVTPRSTKSAWTDAAPLSTALTITSPDVQTLVPTQAQAQPFSVTQSGAAASTTRPLRWISRSPSVATVNAGGTVTGVAAGSAWVVAESDFQRDSVLIAVGAANADLGLIAYYPLNGNGNDASGNGLNGTASGTAAAAGLDGTAGGAVDFGTSGGITVANPLLVKGLTNAMTISFWAKRGTAAWNALGVIPVSRRSGVPIHFSPYWDIANSTHCLQFSSSASFLNGSTYCSAAGMSTIFADTDWHHFAYTQTFGATPGTTIYVDGVARAASYSTGPANVPSNQAALVMDADLVIGRQQSASPGQFNGSMDELRIYNRALSASEIAGLATRPSNSGAFYTFNGTLADSAGVALPATLASAPPTFADRAGVLGQAYRLAGGGSGQEIQLPGSLVAGRTDGTVALWARLDDRAEQYNLFGLGAVGANYPFRAQYAGGPPFNSLYFNTIGGTSSSASLPAGFDPLTWNQYVFTWTATERRIYLNGALLWTGAGGAAASTSGSLRFGNESALGQERFKGLIDDIRIVGRALSPTEVAALYAAPSAQTASLLASYPLDGTGADSSGFGRSGTVTGTTVVPDRFGVAGRAMRFNGVTDAVLVQADAGLSDSAMTEFTLATWMRTVQTSPSVVLGKGDAGARNYEIYLSDGYVYAAARQAAGAGYMTAMSTARINDGQWHQVVAVLREGITLKLFVDGILVTTQVATNDTWGKGGAGPLVIGARRNGAANESFFSGDLDDVRLWRRALTDIEATALFTGPSGPGSPACNWCNVSANLNAGNVPQFWVSGGVRTVGNAALLRNNRIEAQQTDQGSEVGGHGAVPAGTQEVELQWSQNLVASCCGAYRQAYLPSSAGALVMFVGHNGSSTRIGSQWQPGGGTFLGLGGFPSASATASVFEDVPLPGSADSVRVRVLVRGTELRWTVSNLATGEVMARRRTPINTFSLPAVRGAFFSAYQTTGVVTWMDSIQTITRTALSNEPAVIASVEIAGSSFVTVGATAALTATPRDSSSNALAGRTITWTSRTPSVATVNASGTMTGVSQGTSYIIAASEGRADSVLVSVTPAAVNICSISAPLTSGTLPTNFLLTTRSRTGALDANTGLVLNRLQASGVDDDAMISANVSGLPGGTQSVTMSFDTYVPFAASGSGQQLYAVENGRTWFFAAGYASAPGFNWYIDRYQQEGTIPATAMSAALVGSPAERIGQAAFDNQTSGQQYRWDLTLYNGGARWLLRRLPGLEIMSERTDVLTGLSLSAIKQLHWQAYHTSPDINWLDNVSTTCSNAGAPQTVAVSAGNAQSATQGTAVATAPSVLVTDASGTPVPNVPVTFAVASGGGSVSGSQILTNASGVATVGSWTLGSTAGTNTLTATVLGRPAATFTASATAPCAWCNVTATLNSGALPAGWLSGGFIASLGGAGQAPLLQNNRIEGVQVDRGTEVGALGTPPAGTQEVELAWSENLPTSSFGTYTALHVTTTTQTLVVLPIVGGSGPARFYSYLNSMPVNFTAIGGYPGSGGTVTQLLDVNALSTLEDVRTTVVLRSDSAWFTFRRLGTGDVLARQRRAFSGFSLANIRGMFVTAYQTTGPLKWVDSIVTITRSTTTPQPAPIATLSAALGQPTIAVGASTAATATPRDAAANTLTGRTLTWSSRSTGVATVSGAGLVTAVANGTSWIIVSSEGVRDSVLITVATQPNLVATNIATPANLSVGKMVLVSNLARVANTGTATSAGTHFVGYYLSTDPVITTADVYLGGSSAVGVPAVGAFTAMSDNLSVPTTVSPGNYYLGVIVDRDGVIPELDEANGFASATTVYVAAREVLLLTRGTDTTTNWARNALTNSGVPFREVSTAAVTAADYARAVVVAAFTNQPTELAARGSDLASAVTAGSWTIALGLGFHALVQAGWGSTAPFSWGPGANDGNSFVVSSENNGLFNGVSSWSPPTTPDRPEQLIGFVNNGAYSGNNYVEPTSLPFLSNRAWVLSTTYGWSGQSTSSSYCVTNAPLCTGERTVTEITRKIFTPGSGRFVEIGTHPTSYYNYGPVTRQMLLNFVTQGRTTP